MFGTLLEKIVSLVTATDNFQEVYNYEIQKFNGDPVAVVVPSGNEGDYSTTNLNERIYSFSIKVFVSRTARGTSSETEADRILRGLVDSLIDTFDKNYYFQDLTVPTGYCMINVFAVPSQWGYAGAEDEYRVAEIIIRCRVNVDVTLIS